MTGTYFVVTCCGFSGSKWLAAAFDKHPEILCTHAASDFRIWERPYNAAELDACAEVEWKHRHLKSLDDYLGDLGGLGEATVHGNVHRYRVVDLARVRDQWPPEKQVQLVNLVRHPVLWAESGGRHFAHLAETSVLNRFELLQACMLELDFYQSLAQRHQVDLLDWNVLAFLSACQYMSALVKDTQIMPGLRHLPMERITAERELYREVLEGLTARQLDISEAYLDEVFGIGHVNRHRQSDPEADRNEPDRQYAAWPEWKREAFVKFLTKYQVRAAYEPLGYSFSFCDDRAAA